MEWVSILYWEWYPAYRLVMEVVGIVYIWPPFEYGYKQFPFCWHFSCHDYEMRTWEHIRGIRSISANGNFGICIQISNSFGKTNAQFQDIKDFEQRFRISVIFTRGNYPDKSFLSFSPLGAIGTDGYCRRSLRPSVRPSVCPSVRLYVRPSVLPERPSRSISLKISAISLKFGGMYHGADCSLKWKEQIAN